jgi:hypothetical protein
MRRLRLVLPILVFAIALPVMPGCSSSSQQTTSTTDPVTGTTTTTTTNAPAPEEHDSLLGATGHFVWTVVSFPFRVVGDVLGEIV